MTTITKNSILDIHAEMCALAIKPGESESEPVSKLALITRWLEAPCVAREIYSFDHDMSMVFNALVKAGGIEHAGMDHAGMDHYSVNLGVDDSLLFTDMPGITQRVVDVINSLPGRAYTDRELSRILFNRLPEDSADFIWSGMSNARKFKTYSSQITVGATEKKRYTWAPKILKGDLTGL